MPLYPLQRREFAILAGGGVLSLLAYCAMCPWDIQKWMIGAPLGRDFVNFWMAPRLVLAGKGAMLVDLPAYNEAIKTMFGMETEPFLLFVYPPHALLLFTPFAALPFLPAVLLWTAINLAGLALATRMILRAQPVAGPILAVCLSPPAVAMMMYGHFGGLLALATTVSVIEGGRRPILAGLCLAFLSLKPQFACAIGLMLLGAGRWRCLAVGAAVTTGAAVLSAALFGIEVWQRFLFITMPLLSAYVVNFDARMIETSITAYFAARYSGLPAGPAWAIQGMITVFALVAGIGALRKGAQEPGALLVVILAALVMQPYVSHYDLAIAAPALGLVLLGHAPGAAPITVAAWMLTPIARILIVFDLPILGVLVPGALIAQATRLFAKERLPARPAVALDAAA